MPLRTLSPWLMPRQEENEMQGRGAQGTPLPIPRDWGGAEREDGGGHETLVISPARTTPQMGTRSLRPEGQ